MPPPRRRRWRHTIAALVFLIPVGGYVVYSSFHVSDYECTVCIAFEGHQTCRTVTGKTEQEGLRTGVDNACALMASGVTETLRCTRTAPTKAECRRLDQ